MDPGLGLTQMCGFLEEIRKGEEACWNTLCPHSGQKAQLPLPREISCAQFPVP